MSLPRAEEWNDPGPMDGVWKRPRFRWLWLAVPFGVIIAAILVWRGVTLFGLPNIGEPFDLDARGTVKIAEKDNAFTYYRVAISKLKGGRSGGRFTSWANVTEQDRNWFWENNEAVRIWLAGTTMDRAVFIQARDAPIDYKPLDPLQTMRSFGSLAQIAGLRMEAVGDFEAAWTMYRAALRSSRHCAMHAGFVGRAIGVEIYERLAGNILAWADQPNLEIELLRQALDDLIAIESMTPPLSETFEAEYFAYRRLFDQPGLTREKLRQFMEGGAEKEVSFRERVNETLWHLLKREPERSRRVLRLYWANQIAAGDLTFTERLKRRRKFGDVTLYDLPPSAPESARRLTSEQLNTWIESTRLLKPAILSSPFDKAVDRETVTRATLIIHLAERLYAREHTSAPEKTEELVPKYLKALPEGYEPAPAR